MDGKASVEETFQFFQYIRENVSDGQWAELCRVISEALSAGVRLKFDDIIAILESVVISSDDTVTAEDLLRLAG